VLALSAAKPVDHSTRVMSESPVPATQTGYCIFWQGQLFCF
jgi:hypothetical protein